MRIDPQITQIMKKTIPTIHLTLDVGPAVHQQAGLSRYAERLAAHLLAQQSEQLQLSLFYNAHSGDRLPPSLQEAHHRTVRMGQYGWRLSMLLSQLLRSSIYERSRPINPPNSPAAPHLLYHATEHLLPYLRHPTILTVHDLIFEHYPEHHTHRNRLFLKLAMPLFVKAADAIIAVSQQTKQDLIKFYQADADKITVIYQGIDAHFQPAKQPDIQRIRDIYSPERPYLLMVGTLEPRKNHAAAMRALVQLRAVGFPHRLLIAGGQGWLFEPIQKLVHELGLENDVTFTGYVPFEDLPALYAGADCVLQPSLFEGFGFPVLEAMACGAPVVCSNVSSLPEAAGDAALQVAPEDVEGLSASVQQILTEPGLAEMMRQKGLKQASDFRWERCAEETLNVYRMLVEKAKS